MVLPAQFNGCDLTGGAVVLYGGFEGAYLVGGVETAGEDWFAEAIEAPVVNLIIGGVTHPLFPVCKRSRC